MDGESLGVWKVGGWKAGASSVFNEEDIMYDVSCARSSPISASCKRSLDCNDERTLPGEILSGGRLADFSDLVGEALNTGMSQMLLPVNA